MRNSSSSWRSRISRAPRTCSDRSTTGRDGVDGWVSLEVSPLLAHDTASTLAAAKELFARAGRPNLFIKIPGTKEGLPAIEEAIFAGVPGQRHPPVLARALPGGRRGVPARHRATHRRRARARCRLRRLGVRQPLGCAVAGKVPAQLAEPARASRSRKRTYAAYRALLDSPRWQRVCNAGARPQRLLWASTGTKDPHASDILYVKALAAPFTVNTMPEATLEGARRTRRTRPAPAGRRRRLRGGAGASSPRPASRSMRWPPGSRTREPKSFVQSWNDLLAVIASKSVVLARAS